MFESTPVVLPIWLPALIAAAVGGLISALWLRRRRLAKVQDPIEEERDWSIPELVPAAPSGNLFQRWDTRIKLATLFAYSFLVVSLQRPAAAALAAAVSALAAGLARVSPTGVLKRLAGISGFVVMLLLVMPLTVRQRPGDVIAVLAGLEGLTFNLRGFTLALVIAGKAAAVALLMEPMLATSDLGRSLEALTRLGVPAKLTQMVLLSHRYIHVLAAEGRRMRTAMGARGFRRRTDLRTLRTLADFLGMLFVRSFDRTQRVQDAMLARGFTGRFPLHHRFSAVAADWLLAGVWAAIGLLLLGFDRLGR